MLIDLAGMAQQINLSKADSLSKIYVKKGRFHKAIPYLKILTADSNRKFESAEMRRRAFYDLYRADSADNDWFRASSDLKNFQALKDSAFNVTASAQLKEMTVKYETEKKDRSIARLIDEAKLRETELAKDRLLLNTLVGGALLLSLLSAVIYNRYRLRQHNNQILQQLNDHQKQLISDKQLLVRETHHRAKKDLELVLNLLNMQAATLNDEFSLNAFTDISSRIRAISLVHQKLYHDKVEMTSINMGDYVNELVGFLQNSISFDKRIQIHFELDPIELEVTQCLPVGLILNEALTNSFKYAFPASHKGSSCIVIRLRKEQDEFIQLLVADNGKGLALDSDAARRDSLGLQLIETLTAQLEGSLEMKNDPGVSLLIRFPRKRPTFISSADPEKADDSISEKV